MSALIVLAADDIAVTGLNIALRSSAAAVARARGFRIDRERGREVGDRRIELVEP
jgi:hypothetical protein